MHTNPHRHEQEPGEITGPLRVSRRERRTFSFWERAAAADLEKGGFWLDTVREAAQRGSDVSRYQVWLYDHRPQEGA